jgi:hypothetical protein
LITACQAYADAVCKDITPPVVTLNPPNPQFQQAGTTWVDPGATAYDTANGVINSITRTPTGPNVFLLQPQNVSVEIGKFVIDIDCLSSFLQISKY